MKAIPILFLFAQSLLAAYLPYDSDRRVPYANASIYSRAEFDWWKINTGEPSRLFLNGVYQNQETGSFDLGMDYVWAVRPDANGVTVAVVGVEAQHNAFVGNLVKDTAPGCIVTYYQVSRFYPDVISPAIIAAVNAGNKIIVLPTGWAADDQQLHDAINYAYYANRLIVCSVPNQPQDLTTTPDYPTSWHYPNTLSVANVDRAGLHYWSATGVNVVGAPGRNICLTDENGALKYSSGTSYSVGIAAGCAALYWKHKTKQNASGVVNRIIKTSDNVDGTLRLNPLQMLTTSVFQ